jgi:superfamily II DNA/RNA helicase
MGRRNIVGAAPTGSGKTLAYLLSIVQYVLLGLQQQQEEEAAPMHSYLSALILL